MKIRSDFVTNSSSESFGEIIIDNLVLLEILARYKEIGLFKEYSLFSVGSYDDNNIYSEYPGKNLILKTLTPALHWFTDDRPPDSLDKVLENIIEIMEDDSYEYDEELLEQLEKELRERKEEIESAYVQVSWYSRIDLYSGHYGYFHFKYDQTKGESYYDEQTAEDVDLYDV